MAGPGRAPKAVLTRPNDQARREAAATKVEADGVVRGPDLPDRPGRFDADTGEWQSAPWPAQTLAWWETWRLSAQAQTLTATDWDFLLDTALLHADMWSGDVKVAPELRLRVAKFGATPEDRLRLRLSISSPEEPSGKPAAAAIPIDRRQRVMRAVHGSA